jgi:Flp pilus assembly pilin Flp
MAVEMDESKMLHPYLYLRNWLQCLQPEEGQDLIEYALLLTLVALVCLVAITMGGRTISQVWVTMARYLRDAMAGI